MLYTKLAKAHHRPTRRQPKLLGPRPREGCVSEAEDPPYASLERQQPSRDHEVVRSNSSKDGGASPRTGATHTTDTPLKHPACCSHAHAAPGREDKGITEQGCRRPAGIRQRPTHEDSNALGASVPAHTCIPRAHARLTGLQMHTHTRAPAPTHATLPRHTPNHPPTGGRTHTHGMVAARALPQYTQHQQT